MGKKILFFNTEQDALKAGRPFHGTVAGQLIWPELRAVPVDFGRVAEIAGMPRVRWACVGINPHAGEVGVLTSGGWKIFQPDIKKGTVWGWLNN